nr:heat shock protein 90-6, mitochondrial [Ipomoea batatas]
MLHLNLGDNSTTFSLLQEASKNSPDDEEALRAIGLLSDAALVSSGFT